MRNHEFLEMAAVLALVLLVGWIASVNPFGIDEYVQRILGGLAGQGSCPNDGWGHPSC
jgi:hypothetical protein